MGVAGEGPGDLPGTAPLRAGQQGLPASGRVETPGLGRSVRGRRDCQAGERASGRGRWGGRRGPVTARSGPLGGSVRRWVFCRGPESGVALLGAEERAGGPEMPTPFGSPFSWVRGGLGEAGPAAPLGATSSLGLSPPRGEDGAPPRSTLSQAASLALGYLLSPRGCPLGFPGTGPFLQCPRPGCGVDSGRLLNRSCIGSRGMPGTGRGLGWRGEPGQAGWGSELESGFLFGAPPMKPAGLHADAFRVNSEAVCS